MGSTDEPAFAGFALTGLVSSSEDDRDRGESLHRRAIEEWLAASPGAAASSAVQERRPVVLAPGDDARAGAALEREGSRRTRVGLRR